MGCLLFWRGGGEVGGAGAVKAGWLGVCEEGWVEECCFVF